MSSHGDVRLCDVQKLNTRKDWRKFNRGIKIWLTSKQYNKPVPVAPTGVATRASAAALTARDGHANYYIEFDKWKLTQELAINSIHSRLGNRAFGITDSITDLDDLLTNLKAEFEPRRDALLDQLENTYAEMSLNSFPDIEEYINAFDKVLKELKEIGVNKTQDHSRVVRHFIIGLGLAFESWHQSFNQQHYRTGKDRVKLSTVQDSASTEASRIKGADVQRTLLTTQKALLSAMISASTPRNPNRKCSREDRN